MFKIKCEFEAMPIHTGEIFKKKKKEKFLIDYGIIMTLKKLKGSDNTISVRIM